MTDHIPKPEPTGAIALIEAHDSRVSSVDISPTGHSHIEFEHLAVYHQTGPESFTIWSYRAVLEADEVEQFTIYGSITMDYVDDSVIVLDGHELPGLQVLLNRQPVSEIKLTFGSGRTIEMHCHNAQLRLYNAIKPVEEWVGPLYSPK